MDGIGKTSLLTAAMRAKESSRSEAEGRLFQDPLATLLAGNEGHELLEQAIKAAGDQPAIAIRTYFMDQKISQALKNGIRQVVLLAAGMDTRPFRMEVPPETRWFELDRDEVLIFKNERLSEFRPRCGRICVPTNLLENWNGNLQQAGFDSKQNTLWLIEGLLMYLEKEQVMDLLAKLNQMAKPKDILLLDILSQTLLEVPHMKSQLKFLESVGAPWKFGVNDPVQFLRRFGWEASLSQAGDVAPERWPFPTLPLHVQNVPRGYFVLAHRMDI